MKQGLLWNVMYPPIRKGLDGFEWKRNIGRGIFFASRKRSSSCLNLRHEPGAELKKLKKHFGKAQLPLKMPAERWNASERSWR